MPSTAFLQRLSNSTKAQKQKAFPQKTKSAGTRNHKDLNKHKNLEGITKAQKRALFAYGSKNHAEAKIEEAQVRVVVEDV